LADAGRALSVPKRLPDFCVYTKTPRSSLINS